MKRADAINPKRRAWPRPAATALAIAALAIPAASAQAAATRAEYVAQVDPICLDYAKPAIKAFAAYFKAGARKRKPSARPTARFLSQISRAYGNLTERIATVPAAPGDEAIVSTWLGRRAEVVVNLGRARRAARHGKLKRSDRLAGRAGFGAASQVVSEFGFDYCAPPGGAVVTL